jgi:pimeloyl-ACP methyl ester carboxylesterase
LGCKAVLGLLDEPACSEGFLCRTVQAMSSAPAFASFVPDAPRRVLVIAHGFPWPDNSRTDAQLLAYASARMEAWKDFARRHGVILIAPVFGGTAFPGYREMTGACRRPDEFVNQLVENLGRRFVGERFDGRFSLHGHSAGGQFAARYLLSHPGRLREVILSAPSAYPFPDPHVMWPYGMAAGRDPLTGHAAIAPPKTLWIAAATTVTVSVLVGSSDVEDRPSAPGQVGSSRLTRGRQWVEQMRALARAEGLVAKTGFVVVEGLGHDEDAMTAPVQARLADDWRGSQPQTSGRS